MPPTTLPTQAEEARARRRDAARKAYDQAVAEIHRRRAEVFERADDPAFDPDGSKRVAAALETARAMQDAIAARDVIEEEVRQEALRDQDAALEQLRAETDKRLADWNAELDAKLREAGVGAEGSPTVPTLPVLPIAPVLPATPAVKKTTTPRKTPGRKA